MNFTWTKNIDTSKLSGSMEDRGNIFIEVAKELSKAISEHSGNDGIEITFFNILEKESNPNGDVVRFRVNFKRP